jgi:hypothetical protein
MSETELPKMILRPLSLTVGGEKALLIKPEGDIIRFEAFPDFVGEFEVAYYKEGQSLEETKVPKVPIGKEGLQYPIPEKHQDSFIGFLKGKPSFGIRFEHGVPRYSRYKPETKSFVASNEEPLSIAEKMFRLFQRSGTLRLVLTAYASLVLH